MPTHREQVFRRYGLDKSKSYNLTELAKITKFPKRILQEVYNRGTGAWKTNPTSVRLKGSFQKDPNPSIPRSKRLSKEQWSYARVFSFINGGKTTKTADKDLYDKIKSNVRK